MNKLTPNHQQGTLGGSLLIVAGIVGAFANISPAEGAATCGTHKQDTYALNHCGSTFSETAVLIKTQEPEVFEQIVSDFYEKLLSEQEPLEREFEEVLYANLWDLYMR